jgi:hypothetical protein
MLSHLLHDLLQMHYPIYGLFSDGLLGIFDHNAYVLLHQASLFINTDAFF